MQVSISSSSTIKKLSKWFQLENRGSYAVLNVMNGLGTSSLGAIITISQFS